MNPGAHANYPVFEASKYSKYCMSERTLFLYYFLLILGEPWRARKPLMRITNRRDGILNLRVGEWVEVRSREEITAMLDAKGKLDGLPFMAEMLSFCGGRFQVIKRADKTCDEATTTLRRLRNTVHLDTVRCDGRGHGGCDAGCLIFWDERWLKRWSHRGSAHARAASPKLQSISHCASQECSVAREKALPSEGAGSNASHNNGDNSAVFSCQATEIAGFSSPLQWWEARQYWEDLSSGNVTFPIMLSGLVAGARGKIKHIFKRRPREVCGVRSSTPAASLDLQPGDMVQIKSKEEILETLDRQGKNRGLAFADGMSFYFNGTFRVARRVHRIIHPKTGKMIDMKGNCVVLDGVVCPGEHKRFCPRMVNLYWRDVWLKKVTPSIRAGTNKEHSAAKEVSPMPCTFPVSAKSEAGTPIRNE